LTPSWKGFTVYIHMQTWIRAQIQHTNDIRAKCHPEDGRQLFPRIWDPQERRASDTPNASHKMISDLACAKKIWIITVRAVARQQPNSTRWLESPSSSIITTRPEGNNAVKITPIRGPLEISDN
jgi:hypothetical protein